MGRVLCSSDWHGCGKVAEMVFDFLQDDDVLFYLGDAVDRGPNGLELFDRLYRDSRVIFLQGNHEEMMMDAIKRESTYNVGEFGLESTIFILGDWLNNGGFLTWEKLNRKNEQQRLEYISKVNSLPTEFIYYSLKGHQVILEHAGFTPFNVQRKKHDPLWDREHFNDEWDRGYSYKGLNPNSTYLIHGHTPVQYLTYQFGYKGKQPLTKKQMEEKLAFIKGHDEELPKPKILHYCDEHKIDIDMCTIATNRIALIDLDTFEEFYFDCED